MEGSEQQGTADEAVCIEELGYSEKKVGSGHMNNPLVSVCCLAYNHEKYIRQCLDGFVMQKTDFPFEVIVHDDASTDGTGEIIKEYAEKYPEIIKPILQTENQYKKGKMKVIYTEFIYPAASGKYLAYCEGDDFWTDCNKLQKQVEVLENNSNCTLCVHKVQLTEESGTPLSETFPQKTMKTGLYDGYTFMRDLTDGRFFHTSSFVCRTELIKKLVSEMPEFYKTADLDDVPILIYFGQLPGEIYYIDELMSCYRRESTGSWTATERKDRNKTIIHKQIMVKMYEQYDRYTEGKFSDLCTHWINNEKFMIAEIKHDFVEMAKPQYKEWLSKRTFTFRAKINFYALCMKLFPIKV